MSSTPPDDYSSITSQSKAVLLISGTEMWERFSYYGITALLVLYLTAPVLDSGFGWPAADAIRLYGLYAGLAFAAPAVGGWISSSWLGERRCIALGGAAIMLGHVLLGGPAYFPALIESISGAPIEAALRAANLAKGLMSLDANAQAALMQGLTAVRGTQQDLAAMSWAYRLTSWSFFGGLACVIAGTALIKPTISSIVGRIYATDDPRRTLAFTLFMVGVWSGSFFANFVAGTLGERLGWHYGFMSAAVGMAMGLTAYAIWQRRLLGDIGRVPDHAGSLRDWLTGMRQLTSQERSNLAVIGLLSFFTIIYSMAFYQKGGLIHLIVNKQVDRTVGSFEIPAAWFLSISTGSFLVLAPIISSLLTRWRRVPDTAACVSIGLTSLACGYLVLLSAVTTVGAAALPMEWIVTAYVFFGLADVFIWPPQLATVTALAPRSMTSFVVGMWYVTVGVGTYAAGLVGAWAQARGAQLGFAALLALLVAAVLCSLALRRWMLRQSPLMVRT